MTTPNGRGRDWQRKILRRRQARRIARYRIGLIIESMIGDWEPYDLKTRYGRDGVEEIRNEMIDLAKWLCSTGHPDGRSSRE